MKAGSSKSNNSRVNASARKSSPNRLRRSVSVFAKLKMVLLVGIPLIAVVGVIYLLGHAVPSAFKMKAVELAGNEHLTDDELKSIGGLRGDESLLTMSSRKVYEKLKESPWIQTASVRKEYPSKLLIRIRETEPFALLDMKGKMFIVDDRGRMLEELKDNSIPFLPVIMSDPYNEKEAFREAVNLAKVIKNMGVLHKKQRIEIIAHQPNEVAANLDGVHVKVGAGEHEDKLTRLSEIEAEISKRHIPVAYIDLRFAKKAIVKPVNEVIR
ncbi:MAG: FtsQ-type POTRA domain-containing protein [Nitrospirae bacterium]|nr:FtsQ-type POTRA domain-containing protein [Nitrospirota bacterium]